MKLIIEGSEQQIRLYQYLMAKATKHVASSVLPTTKVVKDRKTKK